MERRTSRKAKRTPKKLTKIKTKRMKPLKRWRRGRERKIKSNTAHSQQFTCKGRIGRNGQAMGCTFT